jgi:hypothetical protein
MVVLSLRSCRAVTECGRPFPRARYVRPGSHPPGVVTCSPPRESLWARHRARPAEPAGGGSGWAGRSR